MKPISKIFILPLLFIALFSACSKKVSEEDAVRAVVHEAKQAVIDKDVSAFMRHISKDYTDGKGNDHKGIKGLVFYEVMKPGKLNIFIRGIKVKVEGDRAVADLKAAFFRGEDNAIPDDADALEFSIVFRKESGEWKALSADWARTGIAGLL